MITPRYNAVSQRFDFLLGNAMQQRTLCRIGDILWNITEAASHDRCGLSRSAVEHQKQELFEDEVLSGKSMRAIR